MSLDVSEKDLIARLKAGDTAAGEALVKSCRDPLERFIRLRLGGHLRGAVDVEDVFQDTLAAALGSLEAYRPQGDGSFLRWLKGIAENRILARAKKRRRDQVLFVEAQEVPFEDASPSRAARREERFDRLRAALDRLDPDLREAIVLARLKGLRLKEVARRMDRSPNAVAHLLSRGLERLRRILGDTESFGLPPWRLDGEDSRRSPHDRRD